MRIAYFGYDLFFPCLARLAGAHEIVAVRTWKTDDKYDFNAQVTSLARELGVPLSVGRATPADVEELAGRCDLLVSAGFAHKIPTTPRLRGINVHPTLLPHGRGRWPQPWLLLRHPEAAGVTVHRLSEDFDAGAVLAQRPVAVDERDDLETLEHKLARAAADLVDETVADLDARWESAAPQGEGSRWPMPSFEDRLLHWDQGVAHVLRTVRAFSKHESAAEVEGRLLAVTRANGFIEAHGFSPGTLVSAGARELLVAASDGFVLLQEWADAPTE